MADETQLFRYAADTEAEEIKARADTIAAMGADRCPLCHGDHGDDEVCDMPAALDEHDLAAEGLN